MKTTLAIAMYGGLFLAAAGLAQQTTIERIDVSPVAEGASGACCLPNDMCVLVDVGACGDMGGTFYGEGTACAPAAGGVDCSVPVNDDCENAIPVSLFSTTFGTTIGATEDFVPDCFIENSDGTHAGVWYVVGGEESEITASLCNPDTLIEARISVYCGCDNLRCVASAESNCPPEPLVGGLPGAQVTWCGETDQDYYILVEHTLVPGDFILNVSQGSTCFPPADCEVLEECGADHCEDAGPICSFTTYYVDNYDATSDYFQEFPNGDINDIFFCGSFFGVYDVWCTYTPGEDGLMFAHIEGPSGSGVEWVFGIYDDCPAGPDDLLVCNVFVHHGVLVWEVEAGQTYWIRAAGRNFSRGEFVLEVVGPDCIFEGSQAPSGDRGSLDAAAHIRAGATPTP